MAKAQARPVIVDYFKIISIGTSGDEGVKLCIGDDDGSNHRWMTATPEMTSRMTPKEGDYWVVQADGYAYLNPKEVFERKYGPVELNALELGAAIRREGLTGDHPSKA